MSKFLDHFSTIQELAEIAVNGPSMVKYKSEAWVYLGLYKHFFPRIFGQMESRIVYADIEESQQAVIRYTYWNSDVVRNQLKLAYKSGQTPTISSPVVYSHSVVIDTEWLINAVKRWDLLSIPINMPALPEKIDVKSDEVHQKCGFEIYEVHRVRFERTDNTMLDSSWDVETGGEYKLLEQIWEQLWEELGDYLRTNERIEVEEKWPYDFPLTYSRIDTLSILK